MARPNNNSNGEPGPDLPKVKITAQSLKEGLHLLKYIRPYRGYFIAGLIFISLSAASTMTFPMLLKELIDSAKGVQKFKFFENPTQVAMVMIGLLLLQMFISYMRIFLFTKVGESAVADMRKDIYTHLIRLPIDYFSRHRVGELSSRIGSDVSQIQDTVTSVLAELLRSILTFIIGLGLILYISPKLTLVMLSVIPVIVVVAVVFGKKIKNLSRAAQDKLADSNTIVQETLQGIANVKAFSNEWYERKRYDSSISQVVKLAVSNGKARGIFVSFLLFSMFSAITLVVWYGTKLMQQGQMQFGDLTAFVVYTAFVGGTMAGFADLYSQLQKTIGATQRVREILNEQMEKISLEKPTLLSENNLKGGVDFQNVHFTYPTRPDIPILKGISLSVKPGEQIALVGKSGAGKSTIANLLLGFYSPNEGQLIFDGKNEDLIPLAERRSQMALVPQDVLLFGGSIKENIAYGKPDASMAEIEAAAKQAYAHEFVEKFPERYDTLVGERGVQLSGGQRQRIAIARAILKNPTILILDEATSALDSNSESLVQSALNNLLKGRTSFVIAHRLSTIRNANKIVVLDQGKIIESGTHSELMEQENGTYKELSLYQVEM